MLLIGQIGRHRTVYRPRRVIVLCCAFIVRVFIPGRQYHVGVLQAQGRCPVPRLNRLICGRDDLLVQLLALPDVEHALQNVYIRA